MTVVLAAEQVRAAAHASRFTVVGLAPAMGLDPAPLHAWLEAGHDADMDWMRRRLDERLDPRRVLTDAKTVVALGIAYRRPTAERSRVASYARGRDYHYAHRDRMKELRKRLLLLEPTLETYACVDTGVAMEKPWAERAGLGWIGKNGLLINRELGSWLTLSVMFLDRAVDAYDRPHENLCGDCTRCLGACPTQAFPSPGVVDARRCIAYQSIENRDVVPLPLRKGFAGRMFGCDVCQDVCPFNRDEIPVGDRRFEPRALGLMTPLEVVALTEEQFKQAAAGMAVMRVGYDGLRRNALYAIGMSRTPAARAIVERLCADPSPVVADAARWTLARLT
ncbi:MAG TPA: tRNA epoxyqueuosine(34) reductase QueG [Polyangia bacterium]|nr:tRNA epoxyqueuosine(34) reductase QueG [Polyangia bacterium]